MTPTSESGSATIAMPLPVPRPAHGALPVIIQGGMGVGVSGWRLARAVSLTGQLGVISGLGLDTLLARRLQLGDESGDLRRALRAFPIPAVAEWIVDRYFIEGGLADGAAFMPMPRLMLRPSRQSTELMVAANFVEIFLAKEGHDGIVGVNYLEKIQMATPAALYGAMLAGVDYVLMGAGVPAEIPALLDAFAQGEPGSVTVTIQGPGGSASATTTLSPHDLFGAPRPLTRPLFLAIVSSSALVTYLARERRTTPDGFVIEGFIAGGHSARPRGAMTIAADGDPEYGPRDVVDLRTVQALGLPYWLAGGFASPDRLQGAKDAGAAGVQVGSAFALSEESGLDPAYRRQLLDGARAGTLHVRADVLASPTAFPFKVAELPHTLSEPGVYEDRKRVCDIGGLRMPYRNAQGKLGYRCPSEPVGSYVRKGGALEDTDGRRCLCNGLIAAIGLAQRLPDGTVEPAIVTIGQDLSFLPALLGPHGDDYAARDVVEYLLAGPKKATQA